MDMIEAIQNRHSVRSYTDTPIGARAINRLNAEIDLCNKASGLHIRLITNDPDAFTGLMAHYGKFRGVKNYIALIGTNDKDLEEKAGYYGEHLVLIAQQMGLNTCWVALTYSRARSRLRKLRKGEKLVCVIALGIGTTHGVPHKSKPMEALYDCPEPMPDWFRKGMKMAILAPTATNQQKFKISYDGSGVRAASVGGFYSKVDLGIVKYHFEAGAGKDSFKWSTDVT